MRGVLVDEVQMMQRGSLGIITLNRPHALNALTTRMCRNMILALLQWREDPSIKQVLVTGAGDRGLCAGGDIVAIYQDITDRRGVAEEFWRIEYQLNTLIAEYPKPYIALMDGIVFGGGIGISAHGSHRVVTERSKCAMPEVTIGFFPDVGGTHLLARAPRAAGRYAALTGLSVGAADAIYLGLADVHVGNEDLPEIISQLTTRPADSVLSEFSSTPAAGILDQAWVQAFAHTELPSIKEELHASDNSLAREALLALNRASPSAVHLVNRLSALAGENLREDLTRELRAAVHRLDDPDFAEGIRAAVIDKDRTPRWVNLTESTQEQHTAAQLGPLPGGDLSFELID